MIQWQQMRMPYDDETGLMAARLFQPVHEAGQRCPPRPLPPDPGENSGGDAHTHCDIHENLLLGVGCVPSGFTVS
jgi:hypothetical protein